MHLCPCWQRQHRLQRTRPQGRSSSRLTLLLRGLRFASGTVSLGNFIIELVETNDTSAAMPFVPDHGVALTPFITMFESRARAATRGIELGADDSFYEPRVNLLWTRALVLQLSGASRDTFFCDYATSQWPLRAGSLEKLAASNGGTLGITGVDSMTVKSARY